MMSGWPSSGGIGAECEIGERAFADWLSSAPTEATADGNAALIVDTLWPLVQQGTLVLPRGNYVVRRGRGRIIVDPAKSKTARRGLEWRQRLLGGVHPPRDEVAPENQTGR